jgi:hypothetical protein
MSAPVTAALISGGAALVVAVLGIFGAIAAQAKATRRAFENSLALFEKQRDAQQQEQKEQARREDAYRFADQRRSTYARFLQMTAELAWARQEADDADGGKDIDHYEEHQELYDHGGREPPGPAEIRKMREEAWSELDKAMARWGSLRSAATVVADEVQLLASPTVRRAADELWREASWPPEIYVLRRARHPEVSDSGEPEVGSSRWHYYDAARAAFVETARRELGVTSDEHIE